jgi:phosphatidylglycerophosphatase A
MMDLKKCKTLVIESLRHRTLATEEPFGQDPKTQRHDDTKTLPCFLLLATGFGVGYSPIAPGTLGTLLAIPFFLLLSTAASPVYELTLVGFFFLSVWVSGHAERSFRRRDDPRIVIDEMIGFFVTMLWVPGTPLLIILGFFFFRFFDILKPFPIRLLESKLKGGFGIVLDDILAGVYANIILEVISLIAM